MHKYRIKLSYPGGMVRTYVEKTAIVKFQITKEIKSIYEAIALFEDKYFKVLKDSLNREHIEKWVELKKVRNIHDHNGIKDKYKIKRMLNSLEDRRHILNRSGMPNIKVFKARDNKLYLFDGHHSMLAYMKMGKKHLNEVPHLLIERKDGGYICEEDFKTFFGRHLKHKRREKWGTYTVNWQATRSKQLCERAQKNMVELFQVVVK